MPEQYEEQQYVKVDVENVWKKESFTVDESNFWESPIKEILKNKIAELNKKIDDLYDVWFTDIHWEKDLTDQEREQLSQQLQTLADKYNNTINNLVYAYQNITNVNKEDIRYSISEFGIWNIEFNEEQPWTDAYANNNSVRKVWILWKAFDARYARILKENLRK